MIGYIVTNNAADYFVIMENNGDCIEAYQFGTIDGDFADALLTGDAQHLRNWSGGNGAPDPDTKPEHYGTVIATNDGTTLRIIDNALFNDRRQFWLGE